MEQLPYNGVLQQPVKQRANLLEAEMRARTFPGLRLSIDCPLERVRAYFHPEGTEEFNKGVAVMGHLLANIFCDLMIERSDSYATEVDVPWSAGNIPSHTHIDLVSNSSKDAIDGVYEIKTTSDKNLRPRAETIRQVHRQQGAIYRAGSEHDSFYLLEKKWYNVIIGKAGNSSGWVSDRFLIEFDSDAAEYAALDHKLTDELVRLKTGGLIDLLDDDEVASYCMCGKCIPKIPNTDVSDEIAQQVSVLAALRRDKNSIEGKISDALAPIKAANLAADTYELDDGTLFTVSKNGVITIRNNT